MDTVHTRVKMPELPEYVEHLLHKIAVAEGFADHEIKTVVGSKQGDGFMGVMVSVKIVGQRYIMDVPMRDTLHLLCKLSPSDPMRREQFHSAMAFKREAMAYNEILPCFEEFQREKGLSENEQFRAHAKCYAASSDATETEYALILEDLKSKKFEVLPKELCCSSKVAHIVFESMAKFHAISFALKDQRPAIYNGFRSVVDNIRTFYRSGTTKAFLLSSFKRAMVELREPRHLEIVQQMHDRSDALFEQCFGDGVADPYSVLAHGDFWNNNMMFDGDGGKVCGNIRH